VLILGAAGIAIIWYNPCGSGSRAWKPWVPLAVCATILAVFALSSRVTLLGKPILTLGHAYRPVMDTIVPFRASGRFIWPLHYVSIAAIAALGVGYYRPAGTIINSIYLSIMLCRYWTSWTFFSGGIRAIISGSSLPHFRSAIGIMLEGYTST